MKPISEMKILYNRVKKNHTDVVVLVKYDEGYTTFKDDAALLSKRLGLEIQGESVCMKEERVTDLIKLSIPFMIVEKGKDNRGGYRKGCGRKQTLVEGTRPIMINCPPDILGALGSGNRTEKILKILRAALLP